MLLPLPTPVTTKKKKHSNYQKLQWMLLYNYMLQLRQGCTHPGCQDAQAT